MKPTIASVQPFQSDEAICAHIEGALGMGEVGFWMAADGFLDLSRRNWTQEEISSRFSKFDMERRNVGKYIFCARKWPHGAERPKWARAWDEATGRDPMMTSATPEWETPQDIFDVLDAEFHFTLDVCATDENAKCKDYFARESDGLSQDWSGVCWMNPPYGDEIPGWVAKAHESAKSATVVCLVPARVDTEWWWEHCRFGEIRFLRGRLKFGGAKSGAPFPSAVVVFPGNGVRWWEWQKD